MKYFYNKYISGKIANDIQKVDEKIGTLSQLTTSAKTNIVSAINSVKEELKNVITKSMISNQQVNDTGKVPTSALAYSMQQSITKLNNDLTTLSQKFGVGSAIKAKGKADNLYVHALSRCTGFYWYGAQLRGCSKCLHRIHACFEMESATSNAC